MVAPSSAIRVASSSSETTSSPRSGSLSKGGGTRRGTLVAEEVRWARASDALTSPDTGGTLAATRRALRRRAGRLEPEPAGRAAHPATAADLRAPGPAGGDGQDALDGGGVWRVGRAGPGQPPAHGPPGQGRRCRHERGCVGRVQL